MRPGEKAAKATVPREDPRATDVVALLERPLTFGDYLPSDWSTFSTRTS